MPTPEELARQTIDELLTAAGWAVQDRAARNLAATRGVAVREFPLKTGEGDYASATAQKNLNLDTLEKLAVPLPPLLKQRRIAAELEYKFSVVDTIERTSDRGNRADCLRQAVLRRAFAGELD